MRTERIEAGFDRWDALLSLIRRSFAFMDGRIDPPSSAHALTADSLRQKALSEIAYVATTNEMLAGCIFCKPEPPDCLYIGKLAVEPALQGQGIGRGLLAAATACARAEGLPALRLQTRIELIENHVTFAAWGFVKTAEAAHPGYGRTTSIEMRKFLQGPATLPSSHARPGRTRSGGR